MNEINSSPIPEKLPTFLLASYIFLASIIAVLVTLFILNMFAENRVEALQTQAIHLEEEKQAILVKQPKIKDYRKMIDSLPALQASFSGRNVAQSYADFIDLEAKFLTEIQGFAYDGKKITSQFKFRGSSTTTSETANARILRFLDAYKQGVGPNGFTLKPISTISGDESERNISVELTLP